MEEMGADSLCVKDMAGLLSPLDAYDLIKALKESVKVPINLHTHYTSGMGSMTYLKAVEAGVDMVDTSLAPFALRKDKSYFFSASERAFVAYRVVGGVAGRIVPHMSVDEPSEALVEHDADSPQDLPVHCVDEDLVDLGSSGGAGDHAPHEPNGIDCDRVVDETYVHVLVEGPSPGELLAPLFPLRLLDRLLLSRVELSLNARGCRSQGLQGRQRG